MVLSRLASIRHVAKKSGVTDIEKRNGCKQQLSPQYFKPPSHEANLLLRGSVYGTHELRHWAGGRLFSKTNGILHCLLIRVSSEVQGLQSYKRSQCYLKL